MFLGFFSKGGGCRGRAMTKILIVDDTAVNRIVLKVKLGRAHYLPQAACDGASALAALAAGVMIWSARRS